MKLQALGWLTAGVLAAGLNSSYHNGGLEWAHRVADRVSNETNAVLALATGNADRFYAEARVREVRMARVGEENGSPCRLSLALAQAQHAVPEANVAFAQFKQMSDREGARWVRLTARRAQMEAQSARIEIPPVHVSAINVSAIKVPAVQIPAIRVLAIHVPAVNVEPVVVKIPDVHVCPRARVNIPRIPAVKVPAIPEVHVEIPGAGPV